MIQNNLYNKERLEKILNIIRRNHSVSVNYLSDMFHVSTATIRYDLTKLESTGEIIRTHGGAILNSNFRKEPLMNERFNEDKKQLIAQKAIELIQPGDIILIDTGTTMLFFAKALVASSLKNLTIFTNDIDVIRILEEKQDFKLHLFSGRIRNGFHYCYGSQVINDLKKYHFDKLFLASSAVSHTHGLTTTDTELALMKEEMIRASEKIILLTDSTKVGLVNFQKFADLKEIDTLIMDDGIKPEDKDSFKQTVLQIFWVY